MEQEEEKEFNFTEYPNLIPFDCTKEILNQMEKNICKIKFKEQVSFVKYLFQMKKIY